MNYTIKIINSLENSNVLIDGITETVKREIKKRGRFPFALLAPSDTSIVESVIYSVVTVKSGGGVRITCIKNVRYWFTISRLLIISITNLSLMVFFKKN